LLGSHPLQAETVRAELPGDPATNPPDTEYLRACVLESLRSWPIMPVVLRETTASTQWRDGTLPADTSLVVFAPFFDRDERRLPHANQFAPEIWTGNTGGPQLGELTDDAWPLIPFSAGPAVCPGRNLVPLTASAMIGALLARNDLRLQALGRLSPDTDLPGTLSPFELTFATAGR
jgi:cytochrome P450